MPSRGAVTAIRLDGQVAIVTGASRGLGREFALALAERGARVLVHARTAQAAEPVVQAIAEQGGEAMAWGAEITDAPAVQALVAAVLARWGRVDILVNNAGFVRDRSFAKLAPADFADVVNAHLMGSFHCTHAVWPGMLAQGYGRIVMIVSSSGLAGNFGQAAYAAAKMGLVGLAQTLGIEGAARDVHTNCFSPIGITSMNASLIPEHLHDAFAASHLRAGLLWLASPQAPNRQVLMGAGASYGQACLAFTPGIRLQEGTPEELAQRSAELSVPNADAWPASAGAQFDIALHNLKTEVT